MKRLNTAQIKTLYTFTRSHFVEFYDVQTELVDHLANGIETQWELNPNLNFEDALNREFKKFGVFGFSEIVEQKTNALNKRYLKEVWSCVKDYFKLPKIIITFLSIYVIFKLLNFLDNKYSLVLL